MTTYPTFYIVLPMENTGQKGRGGMVTYVNAQSIPMLVRFDKDRQAAFRFDVREWEVGVRASRPFTSYPRAIQTGAFLRLTQIENPNR